MTSSCRLPNLLIVGAAKAGTTSLHALISRHPAAFMSEPKEPRFFAYEGERPEEFGGPGAGDLINSVIKTRAEYERLFAGVTDERVVGESSPAYLYSPVAAARIRETIPDAKMVVLLRDPAERAYSHWVDNVGSGWEPVQDFARVLDLAEERRQQNWWRKWDYIGHGFYAEQLRRYIERFRKDQLKVLMFDDIRGPNARGLDDLFTFLELDPSLLAQQQLPRANAGGLPRSHALTALMSQRNPVRSALRHVLPAGMRRRLRQGLVERNTAKPPLDPHARARLQEIYRADITELEGLLDRDLSAWLRTSS
jgi:hypothetical protein